MTPEKAAYALQLLGEPARTMTSIAKLLGVSRSTLYSALPELLPAQRDHAALHEGLAQLPPDSRPGPPTVDQYDRLLTGSSRNGAGSRGQRVHRRATAAGLLADLTSSEQRGRQV
jgi:hypothetical protein